MSTEGTGMPKRWELGLGNRFQRSLEAQHIEWPDDLLADLIEDVRAYVADHVEMIERHPQRAWENLFGVTSASRDTGGTP